MLVLAVHGSAVPEAGVTIERLAESVRGLTGAPVVVGHLDHRAPSPAEVLASCPGAVVVPLLLGDGYHRTVDIPTVTRRHDCLVTPGLSGVPAVGLALHDRLVEAGGPGDAVVVAGAGSSRPGGNGGTEAAARLLARRVGVPVVTAYCSASEPTVRDAVAGLRAAGHARVAIATHLLAPGRFTHALAAVPGAWTVAAPLGAHPGLAHAVTWRYREAAAPPVTRAGPRAKRPGRAPALVSWGA
ncbi:CbiX/SirB N-terminal domain-containing protein [Streptomyces sp. NPDC050848]|uniref:sirohydrochlorin chelatase n=1 Tax=Streptomyces sp. NPDC050848 TaxID=3155791 RepID=UPI0033EAF4EA